VNIKDLGRVGGAFCVNWGLFLAKTCAFARERKPLLSQRVMSGLRRASMSGSHREPQTLFAAPPRVRIRRAMAGTSPAMK
jgi:hypothetical protein